MDHIRGTTLPVYRYILVLQTVLCPRSLPSLPTPAVFAPCYVWPSFLSLRYFYSHQFQRSFRYNRLRYPRHVSSREGDSGQNCRSISYNLVIYIVYVTTLYDRDRQFCPESPSIVQTVLFGAFLILRQKSCSHPRVLVRYSLLKAMIRRIGTRWNRIEF